MPPEKTSEGSGNKPLSGFEKDSFFEALGVLGGESQRVDTLWYLVDKQDNPGSDRAGWDELANLLMEDGRRFSNSEVFMDQLLRPMEQAELIEYESPDPGAETLEERFGYVELTGYGHQLGYALREVDSQIVSSLE